ncbi:MAG: metal ABC transporter permease [Promethearchaeati archaeon SRVP18_Atabeyarchaeia-1]
MAEALAYSLVIGIFVGLAAGYLGSLMVLKKMALVGDAMSHVALPGLGLGIMFNFDRYLGAFAVLFVAAIIVWYLGRVTKLSYEALIGTLFTTALAVGVLMIPQFDLLEALFGDISSVNSFDVTLAIIVSVVAIVLTRVIYKSMILGMISEELAISKGVKIARINLLYLLLVSAVVALGIRITGTLLVGFLVVVPAVTAKNLSLSSFRYAALSAIFAVTCSLAGILLSSYLGVPPGPMVVLSGLALFLASVPVKLHKG